MKENLMNSAHKTSTDSYREQYDRVFGKRCPKCRLPVGKCRCPREKSDAAD